MNNKIIKPSIMSGFMELTPDEQIEFNRIKDIIKKNYEKSGFVPIDTPVMEKSEILLAKGGDETDKQVYRFEKGKNDISLRFDLTVPFARYAAQHMEDLVFPFRRYQIGKVYRGERSQKGRYREFYQCDIDAISKGELSIVNDAELPSIMCSIFKEIGLPAFKIHINNRKVLNGFFSSINVTDSVEVLRTVDKLDKIGVDKVTEELKEIGLEETSVKKIIDFININGSVSEIIAALKALDIDDSNFNEGLEELISVTHYIEKFGVTEENYTIDLKIARGLDYYTGTVYETMLEDYKYIGSICSGGRYDNLAAYYTKEKLQGVGMSIGLTRLFSQLKEIGVLKEQNLSKAIAKVLVIPMEEDMDYAVAAAKKLRDNNISSQVYLEGGKFGKKLSYANNSGIPYVIIIGEDEVKSGLLSFKNMDTGKQDKLKIEDIISKLK
ncbi:MAG: histidine--tRNA ligase [Clostridium sp.]|nr:histidine--tRNA ligase [Clostridium sp.]